MPEKFKRRIVSTEGSIIEGEDDIKKFLMLAHTKSPDAAGILKNQDLSPEQILATAIVHMGNLEIDFGHGDWREVNQICKDSDLEIEYGPEENKSFPRHVYHFSIMTEVGPITIGVIVAPNLTDLDNDLASVSHRLKKNNLSEKERKVLEQKRDELLLKMKQFVIDKLSEY